MNLYLYVTRTTDYLAGNYAFHAVDHEISIDSWHFAGTVEFTPNIDTKKITQEAIAELDEGEADLRAEFQIRLDRIEESRQRILSIPHLKPVDGAA